MEDSCYRAIVNAEVIAECDTLKQADTIVKAMLKLITEANEKAKAVAVADGEVRYAVAMANGSVREYVCGSPK